MDLTILLTIAGSFIGTIGVTIGLFLHLANKINSKIDNLQNMVYGEMRDFHGRLCAIEERNKGK